VKFALHSTLIGAGVVALLTACGSGYGDGAWRGDVSYEPPDSGGSQVDCPLVDTTAGLTLKICNLPANTVLNVALEHPSDVGANTTTQVRGSGDTTTNLPLGALQAGDTLKLTDVWVDAPQKYLVTCSFTRLGDYATLDEDGRLHLTTNIESAVQTVLCGRTYLMAQWKKYERIPEASSLNYIQESSYLRINADTATAAWLKSDQGEVLYAGSSTNIGGIPAAYAGGRVLLPIYGQNDSKNSNDPVQLGIVATSSSYPDTQQLIVKHPGGTERSVLDLDNRLWETGALLWDGRNPREMFSLGNLEKFYFITYRVENSVNILDYWQTDGTSGGTQSGGLLASLYSQHVGVDGSRPTVTRQGDALYIRSVSGTQPKVYAIRRMNVLTGDTTELLSATTNFNFMAELGNKVLFWTGGVGSPRSDREIAVVDLADQSITTLMTMRGTGTFTLLTAPFGGEIYFTTNQFVNELWKTDGTIAGTHLVKDLRTYTNQNTQITHMAATSKFLFLAARMGSQNNVAIQGLWKSDGTEEGTQLVVEPAVLMPNAGAGRGNYVNGLYVVGERVVFGDDGRGRTLLFNHLWSSDGTAEGTVRLFPDAEVSAVHAANQCPIDCGLRTVNFGNRVGDGVYPLPGNHHLVIRAHNVLPEGGGDKRYFHYWLTDGTPEGSVPLLNESGERFQVQLDRVV